MSIEITKYKNISDKLRISTSELSLIASGGQGVIFKWKNYVIKAIGEVNQSKRWQDIRRRIKNLNSSAVCTPIGQGASYGRDLGYTNALANSTFGLFLFPYIDGVNLNEYLKEENYIFTNRLEQKSERLRLAKELCLAKEILEKSGVFTSDCFADNFMVDRSGKLIAIDLDGGGIQDTRVRLMPSVKGKPTSSTHAPEFLNDEYDIYTERFYTANLLVWILTGSGLNVPFLKKGSTANLVKLNGASSWPPSLIPSALASKYTPKHYKAFWDTHYPNNEALMSCFFKTYVKGLMPHYRDQRASYREFHQALSKIG